MPTASRRFDSSLHSIPHHQSAMVRFSVSTCYICCYCQHTPAGYCTPCTALHQHHHLGVLSTCWLVPQLQSVTWLLLLQQQQLCKLQGAISCCCCCCRPCCCRGLRVTAAASPATCSIATIAGVARELLLPTAAPTHTCRSTGWRYNTKSGSSSSNGQADQVDPNTQCRWQ